MGLIKCPDCGNMVSDRAAACPSCGCPADAFGSAPFSQGNACAEPDLETQICIKKKCEIMKAMPPAVNQDVPFGISKISPSHEKNRARTTVGDISFTEKQ